MSKKGMLGALFFLITIGMMSLAISGKSRFPVVNSGVAMVVLPFEKAANFMAHTCDGLRGYWQALTTLQGDNERLQKENKELRNANIKMAAIFSENQQLRRLLNYKEQHQSQTVVPAKVIARDFGSLRDSLYIDIGKDKGLTKEMAVVDGTGLIGIVDQVYDDYAKVLLITSSQCRIGAIVLRHDSRAVGITNGKGDAGDDLLMRHIYREADIKEGDIIVTSGYSGYHPANILVGKIVAKRMDEVGLLQEAEVRPATDIVDVESVLVITSFTPEPKIDVQGGQAK